MIRPYCGVDKILCCAKNYAMTNFARSNLPLSNAKEPQVDNLQLFCGEDEIRTRGRIAPTSV